MSRNSTYRRPNTGGQLLAGSGRGGVHRDRIDRDSKRQRKNFRNDLSRGKH